MPLLDRDFTRYVKLEFERKDSSSSGLRSRSSSFPSTSSSAAAAGASSSLAFASLPSSRTSYIDLSSCPPPTASLAHLSAYAHSIHRFLHRELGLCEPYSSRLQWRLQLPRTLSCALADPPLLPIDGNALIAGLEKIHMRLPQRGKMCTLYITVEEVASDSRPSPAQQTMAELEVSADRYPSRFRFNEKQPVSPLSPASSVASTSSLIRAVEKALANGLSLCLPPSSTSAPVGLSVIRPSSSSSSSSTSSTLVRLAVFPGTADYREHSLRLHMSNAAERCSASSSSSSSSSSSPSSSLSPPLFSPNPVLEVIDFVESLVSAQKRSSMQLQLYVSRPVESRGKSRSRVSQQKVEVETRQQLEEALAEAKAAQRMLLLTVVDAADPNAVNPSMEGVFDTANVLNLPPPVRMEFDSGKRGFTARPAAAMGAAKLDKPAGSAAKPGANYTSSASSSSSATPSSFSPFRPLYNNFFPRSLCSSSSSSSSLSSSSAVAVSVTASVRLLAPRSLKRRLAPVLFSSRSQQAEQSHPPRAPVLTSVQALLQRRVEGGNKKRTHDDTPLSPFRLSFAEIVRRAEEAEQARLASLPAGDEGTQLDFPIQTQQEEKRNTSDSSATSVVYHTGGEKEEEREEKEKEKEKEKEEGAVNLSPPTGSQSSAFVSSPSSVRLHPDPFDPFSQLYHQFVESGSTALRRARRQLFAAMQLEQREEQEGEGEELEGEREEEEKKKEVEPSSPLSLAPDSFAASPLPLLSPACGLVSLSSSSDSSASISDSSSEEDEDLQADLATAAADSSIRSSHSDEAEAEAEASPRYELDSFDKYESAEEEQEEQEEEEAEEECASPSVLSDPAESDPLPLPSSSSVHESESEAFRSWALRSALALSHMPEVKEEAAHAQGDRSPIPTPVIAWKYNSVHTQQERGGDEDSELEEGWSFVEKSWEEGEFEGDEDI